MRRSLTFAVVALLVVTAPVAAQEMFSLQYFSVVARGPGLAGTQWVTDLVVTNPHDESLTVGIQFFPSARDNIFNPLFPDRITLDPGQTVLVEDVLRTTFGHDQAVKGILVLISDPAYLPTNPADSAFIAVTRTYNVGSPDGTFGQTVPSMVTSTNVGWSTSFITGARNDAEFRSNLGISSTSPMTPVRVHYRIFDQAHTVLAEGSKVIRVASMNQWSFQQLGVGEVAGPLCVELWLEPSDASPDPCAADLPNGFMAYVSKVDNGTGDAEFLMAAPMQPLLCAWDD